MDSISDLDVLNFPFICPVDITIERCCMISSRFGPHDIIMYPSHKRFFVTTVNPHRILYIDL